MRLERSSGILMHITSLPSAFGIGDLGPAAYDFVDFLAASGFSYWQILPLNPIEKKYHYSPYSSCSAFAGNSLLISPELLEKDSLIRLSDFSVPASISENKVIFGKVEKYKAEILSAAFLSFQKKGDKSAFLNFCRNQIEWLEDFCLFQCLTEKYGGPWSSWPAEIRDRDLSALKQIKRELRAEIEKVKFHQFLFFDQWQRLKNYAKKKKISFIGDLPFYINHESADCWTYPQNFKLSAEGKPLKLSGVPPDLFSEEGQLWGTPVYDWKKMEASDFQWWLGRLKWNLSLFEVVRLDHFRAFSAYWEVPAKEKTAKIGKWVKVPGQHFFRKVRESFPQMPFIAEDLGSLDQPVFDLMEEFNFPGMRVLQFAFGEKMEENPYIPYNHGKNSIIYTGTHDNTTTRGWFQNLGGLEKENLKAYAGGKVTSGNIHNLLNRMALSSVGKLCIIPVQDIIGLGAAAKMNLPGTTKGNWIWRLPKKNIPWAKTKELRELNEVYGRMVT